MVKKANFARNAAKWNKEDGGELNYEGLPEYSLGSWLKEGGGGGILAQAGLGAATGGAAGLAAGGIGAVPGAIIGFAGGLFKGITGNRKRKAEEAAQQTMVDEVAAGEAEQNRLSNLATRTENIVDRDQRAYSATFEEGGVLGEGLMDENKPPVITEYSKKANNHNEGVGGVQGEGDGVDR